MKLWIILALIGVAAAAPAGRLLSVSRKKVLADGTCVVVDVVMDPAEIARLKAMVGNSANKVMVKDDSQPKVGDISDSGLPCEEDYIDVGVPDLVAPELSLPAPCDCYDIPEQTKTVAPCTVQRKPCYDRAAPEPCFLDVDGVRWKCVRLGRSVCNGPSLPCGRLINRACGKTIVPCGYEIIEEPCDPVIIEDPCIPEVIIDEPCVVIEEPCIVPEVKVEPCDFSASFQLPKLNSVLDCVRDRVTDNLVVAPCVTASASAAASSSTGTGGSILDGIKSKFGGSFGSSFASASSSSSSSFASASSSSSSSFSHNFSVDPCVE